MTHNVHCDSLMQNPQAPLQLQCRWGVLIQSERGVLEKHYLVLITSEYSIHVYRLDRLHVELSL